MTTNYQKTYNTILSKIRDKYEDVSISELKQLSEIICHRYNASDIIINQLSNEDLTRNMDYFARAFFELVHHKKIWGLGSKHYILSTLYKSSHGLTSESRKEIFSEKKLVIEQNNIGFGNKSGFVHFKFFVRENIPYLFLIHEYGYNSVTNKIEEIISKIESDFLQDIGFDIIEDEVQIYYKDIGNCYDYVILKSGLKNPVWRSLESTEQHWFDQTWDSLGHGTEDEPKQEIYFYEKGKQFDAYKAIRDILTNVKKELFIIDNYVDGSFFLMLELVDPKVKIKLITYKMQGDASVAAEKFKAQRGNVEISKIKDFHDRFILADDDCYMLGASIKDFADKATTLVAIKDKPVISSIKAYADNLFFASQSVGNVAKN